MSGPDTHEAVRLERDGRVAWLVFNEPQRLNPLSLALQRAVRAHAATIQADKTIEAVIVTGEGRGFCVGADLDGFLGEHDDGLSEGQWTTKVMHELSNRVIEDLLKLPVPVVTAVNGACVGAGIGLALCGDVVLMGRSAYLSFNSVPRLGLLPDLGATWFLQNAAGRQRAMAMCLLGDKVKGEDAVRHGLAWECVDDAELRTRAKALAEQLASLPPGAALDFRAAFEHAARHPLVEHLHYEAEQQGGLIDRPAFAEGKQAFLEKRMPRFQRG